MPRLPPRLALTALVSLAGSGAAPSPASACASCGCGDPTISQMGRELPFAGRLRLSLGLRHLTYEIGRPDVDRVEVSEQRADLAVAWSPIDVLTLSLALPVARRRVDYASLARDETFSLADVDLRARVVLFRDRTLAPDHLLSLTVGAELPTTPTLRDAEGERLPIDAHPGTGSLDPLAGLSYAYLRDRGGLFASVTALVPTSGIGGYRNGTTMRATVQGQWQPTPVVAVAFGADARLDGAPSRDGQRLDEGGGLVLYASPALSVVPGVDWVLTLGVRVPVLSVLEGAHREGPIVELWVAHDL